VTPCGQADGSASGSAAVVSRTRCPRWERTPYPSDRTSPRVCIPPPASSRNLARGAAAALRAAAVRDVYALLVVDRRAGDQYGGARSRDLARGVRRDAAVHFQLDTPQAAFVQAAPDGPDLRGAGRNALPAASSSTVMISTRSGRRISSARKPRPDHRHTWVGANSDLLHGTVEGAAASCAR
jgi:hypothetical protein